MDKRTCNVEGCEKSHEAKGWCSMHYNHWHRYGNPLPVKKVRPSPLERILSRIYYEPNTACWLCDLGIGPNGYGQVGINGRTGKTVLNHRFMYETLIGPIPEGLHIDHLCRTPACVNPDHLEPVTPKVNAQRGMSVPHVVARTGICMNGHSMDGCAVNKRSGYRHCKICKNEKQRLWKAAKKRKLSNNRFDS